MAETIISLQKALKSHLHIQKKVKVKLTLEQTMEAHRGSRGTALLFL
jgi:hypothetical protein